MADGDVGGMEIRPRFAAFGCRRGCQCREISCRRSEFRSLPDGRDDAWRLWICQGISCRKISARSIRAPDRPGQPAALPVLSGRTRAWLAEILLTGIDLGGGSQCRKTLNLSTRHRWTLP